MQSFFIQTTKTLISLHDAQAYLNLRCAHMSSGRSYVFLRCGSFIGTNIEQLLLQSTLVISNSKGLAETLRDIRTSTYQS